MRIASLSFLLVLLISSTVVIVFNIEPARAAGTIFIRADGSIDPPTAPIETFDNVTYTFIDTINNSIVVERGEIVVDGVGLAVQGDGAGDGFTLQHVINVTIKNIRVESFTRGFYLDHSSYNTIVGNNITDNGSGIYLSYSYNDTVIGNNITNNAEGVWLEYSSDSTISGNNITGSNLAIYFDHSSYNTIVGNNIIGNYYGVMFSSFSNYNTFSGNNLIDHPEQGLWLSSSSHNSIYGNNLEVNLAGVALSYASNYNTVTGNNITNNHNGVELEESSNNTVSGNNIKTNVLGVWASSSTENRLFHNNFIDNQIRITTYDSMNHWDDNCEGNYWDDYEERYPNATYDNHGIGDTPCFIDENNTDRFPLMNHYWNPGDVNHDLEVDIFDIVRFAGAYQCTPSDPSWNCHCDITEPFGVVDIFDVVMAAGNYGEHW